LRFRLDQIKKDVYDKYKTLKISIPGDGEFKIRNERSVLEAVKKRVQRMQGEGGIPSKATDQPKPKPKPAEQKELIPLPKPEQGKGEIALPKDALNIVKAEGGRFKAGFLDKETGKIYNTGQIHDASKLPSKIEDKLYAHRNQFEAGFIDSKGKFYTRDEALKALEQPAPAEAKEPSKPDLAKQAEGKPDLAEHRKNLLAKAEEYDKKRGVTIKDVTPEGYGPTEPTAESVQPSSEWHLTTEQQKLRASINEAQTLLKGKLSTEKRNQIERSLKQAQDKFDATLTDEQKRQLNADKLGQDIPVTGKRTIEYTDKNQARRSGTVLKTMDKGPFKGRLKVQRSDGKIDYVDQAKIIQPKEVTKPQQPSAKSEETAQPKSEVSNILSKEKLSVEDMSKLSEKIDTLTPEEREAVKNRIESEDERFKKSGMTLEEWCMKRGGRFSIL
jgi:hypothetical protein